MKIIALIFSFCLLVSSLANAQEQERTETGQIIPVESLYMNADSSLFKISPNGQLIGFSAKIEGGFRNLQVIDVESNKVVRNIGLKNSGYMRDFDWVSNDRVLITLTDKKSGKEVRLLVDFSGDKLVSQRLPTDVTIHSVRHEQQDGVVLISRSSVYQGSEHAQLLTINIDEFAKNQFMTASVLAGTELGADAFIYDTLFKKIISLTVDRESKTLELRYADVGQDNWQRAILYDLEDETDPIIPVGFAGEDKFSVISDRDTDTKALRIYDIKTGQLLDDIAYENPDYDLIDAQFTTAGELHSVTYIQDGLHYTEYFSEQARERYARIREAFAQSTVSVVSSSDDNRFQILYTNGSTDSGFYYLFDSHEQIIRPLEARFDDLQNYILSASELLRVKTADGTEIEAYLNRPQGSIDHNTLIVMPHGGPIGVRDYDYFNPDVQFLTSRGFSVLRVNFRGSSGFGKSFTTQGVGQFGQLIEDDITAAVDQVLARKQFKNICAAGNSYGAYSATMLAMRQPQRYGCVIAGFGIFDLPLIFNASNYRSTDDYRSAVSDVVGEYHKSLTTISPAYRANELKAPILIFAGYLDEIADYEHSWRMKLAVEAYGNNVVEFINYTTASHGHKTWWGDRHEAVAKYDFLVRQLHLSPFRMQLIEADKSTLQNEYELLANGFVNSPRVQRNLARGKATYDYLSKHSKNSTNSYHLGQLTLKDITDDRDISRGLALLEESAKQGNQNAIKDLSKIYISQSYGTSSIDKAKALVSKLTYEGRAKYDIDLANAYIDCYQAFANSVCVQPLVDKLIGVFALYDDGEWRNDLLSRIMLLPTMPEDDYQPLRAKFEDKFELTMTATKIISPKAGMYEQRDEADDQTAMRIMKAGNTFNLKSFNDTTELLGIMSSAIAIEFNVNFDGYITKNERASVLYQWESFDLATGEALKNDYGILIGYGNSTWRVKRTDLEPNTRWKLTLYNIARQEIYSEEFTLLP
ncbi:alpha/beta hydrolase family protein [Pseudidiomarina donghaiensis]|uniref:alpha/beta hydrolase family protein n=1 Tax=Pseudidiomarina donghaiensis TaxID=519452 RepID=UPI003A96E12C